MRNVKKHKWNHKRVYRIYRDLVLNLRIKPRKRLNRDKPEPLAVPETINTQNIESNDKIATLVPEAEPVLEQIADTEISTVIFTFSGDCWVNIYDNTGERIAWGVKKSGYEMTISGQAPFKVTLGRPELAAIVFNNQTIDMSSFSAGNIAKFTLPLTL